MPSVFRSLETDLCCAPVGSDGLLRSRDSPKWCGFALRLHGRLEAALANPGTWDNDNLPRTSNRAPTSQAGLARRTAALRAIPWCLNSTGHRGESRLKPWCTCIGFSPTTSTGAVPIIQAGNRRPHHLSLPFRRPKYDEPTPHI